MVNIQSNLDGRQVGVSAARKIGGAAAAGYLISKGGAVWGEHGNQFIQPSPWDVVTFDDFDGDVTAISPRWIQRKGTNNPTAPVPLSGGIGGICRITSGAAGTGLAADENSLVETLQWSCANGGLNLQTRLLMSAITTCWAFIGFTDTAATVQIPIQSAGAADTFTNNAANAVGFMFDTSMATKNWWGVGVNAGVGATNQNLGVAPVVAKMQTFRLSLNSTGGADFFINGLAVGSRMLAAYAPATVMTPIIAVGKNSVAAAMTMDVDYIHASMVRNVDGAAT